MQKNWLKEPWLKWAIEFQSLAQCGWTYTKDVYDQKRSVCLKKITAEMLSYQSDLPFNKVKTLSCNEKGYQTPQWDTRATIFQNNQILLVHEKNRTWSLPGGWVDVLESIESNTIKEVKSRWDVKVDKVIVIQDRNKHNFPPYAYGVCKIFLLCHVISGTFIENIKTIGFDYFSWDDLPHLAEEKCHFDQIKMCFQAYHDDMWKTQFD